MKVLAHSSSFPLAGVQGTKLGACAAFSAMSSAASMYLWAFKLCTVRNCALLRKPSDSASGGNSRVAVATTPAMSATSGKRSVTVLRYSALLSRRRGALPGFGVVHVVLLAPPFVAPPLEAPPVEVAAPEADPPAPGLAPVPAGLPPAPGSTASPIGGSLCISPVQPKISAKMGRIARPGIAVDDRVVRAV